MEELFRRLSPAMGAPRSGTDAIAAALEAAQRLAAETDAEDAASDIEQDLSGQRTSGSTAGHCPVCGYNNRGGNKFCAMCGAAVEAETAFLAPHQRRTSRGTRQHPNPFLDHEPQVGKTNPHRPPETHHLHTP